MCIYFSVYFYQQPAVSNQSEAVEEATPFEDNYEECMCIDLSDLIFKPFNAIYFFS